MRTLEIALLVTTSLVACSSTDSTDVKTSGIWADMSATATGEGTTEVDVTLYVGRPIDLNFVELTGGDTLVAVHDGTEQTLQQQEFLNVVGHHASFDIDAEDEAFDIQFLRADGDDAPSSTATIPAPFAMEPAPASASRAEPLTLSWTSAFAPEPMDWTASGDCIRLTGGTITAPNTVTIAASTFESIDEAMPGTCEVTIHIYRRRAGRLDGAFKDGAMFGQQRRWVVLTSTP